MHLFPSLPLILPPHVLWEYFQFQPLGGAYSLSVVYQRARSDPWIKSKDFGGNCSDVEGVVSFLPENPGSRSVLSMADCEEGGHFLTSLPTPLLLPPALCC